MQKLPVGIQDFRSLREDNFLYIDKTKYLYELITKGKYYFLSRPRRFGKSLTVNTLAEVFKGSKDLFAGLWIEDQWDWNQKNPIIQIGFSSMGYKTLGLEKAIYARLSQEAQTHDIELKSKGYDNQFRELIHKLAEKEGKVVILIDEYDKPIIDYLENPDKAKAQRDILKTFYSVLKDADAHLQLVFITGVSKFSKTSIFSELNNLYDLTMSKVYNALCGYTQEELEHAFTDEIHQLAAEHQQDESWALNEVKKWYNGYTWGNRKQRIYNPFSILQVFSEFQFRNFWFESGTPTFLIKLLGEKGMYDMENIQATGVSFGSYELDNISPITLLFQTGYITIKEELGMNLFVLGYPNQEVRESMLQYLITDYTQASQGLAAAPALQMAHAILKGETAQLQHYINALLGSIPYDLHQQNEAYYHTVMYLAFSLIGVHIQSEIHVAKGRLDSVIQTPKAVYIFEFKVDSSAEEAIHQIQEKNYAQPFLDEHKPVYAIGVNFNTNLREVDGLLIEAL
ncbi:MAG: AAA family ATPase [Flammeovirgaceae bacterium]